MLILKKIFGALFSLLKKGTQLLRGQGLESIAKKLGLVLGALFLSVFAGKSLLTVRHAKKRAGKKTGARGKSRRMRKRRKTAKKKSFLKKIALLILSK